MEPVVLEIAPGFTALVGPNNAGKSSAKLLFYELRPLFAVLTQMNVGVTPGFYNALAGNTFQSGFAGVTDPEEIFNNTNNRPLVVEVEVVGATSKVGNGICKIVMSCARDPSLQWTISAFGTASPNVQISCTTGFQDAGDLAVKSGDGSLHVDTQDLFDVLRAIVGARYYGPFRNAINQGAADYFDLRTGSAFVDLWNSWKTSGIKAQTRAIGRVTEDIRALFEFKSLEINASIPLKTLMVTIDGHTYRLAELGSGIAQFIMVLGNAATTKPSLVLIDEPETNLHPSLQIDFMLALAQYSDYGCVFSTHSIGLAHSVGDRIYSFQKSARGPIVRALEATPNYAEFLGELSFSSFKEMGFDRILLVEGVNDVKALQQLLRLVKKEHQTVILPLGGNALASGGREGELGELLRLSQNVFAIVDSERTQVDGPLKKERAAFEQSCNSLGIKACVTERRALENYFTDAAVKSAFGGSFSNLKPYQSLKELPNGWSKSDNWRIARHMTIDDVANTDVGKFLQSI